MPPDPSPTLQLSREAMRDFGYRIVDMLVDHFDTLPDKPVTEMADRSTLEQLLREPIPEQGAPPEDVLAQVERDVFSNMMHLDHPRFLALVSSPGNYVSAMADALTAGFNPFLGNWMEASGPTEVELVTIDWLRQLCGLPEGAGGLFVSGGSMANLTALATARHIRLGVQFHEAVIYASDQAHSSVSRGLKVLGFKSEQICILTSDETYRIPVEAVKKQISQDRKDGKQPFCIIANAGTTNTGAIDPLHELADLCQEENLWLHADGAYGAATVITEEGRALLAGLDRVDSMALDPHKWLFQPYEIGCVLVRNRRHLRETFHVSPEYLQDMEGEQEEVNLYDYGIQLTRSFRALKLWMSLKVFGLAAFRQAVTHGLNLARIAEGKLKKMSGWEIITPAQMGIVTFRYVPQNLSPGATDTFNRELVAPIVADGFALVVSTIIKNRTVLRFCTINPRTTEEDIGQVIKKLDQYAQEQTTNWK